MRVPLAAASEKCRDEWHTGLSSVSNAKALAADAKGGRVYCAAHWRDASGTLDSATRRSIVAERWVEPWAEPRVEDGEAPTLAVMHGSSLVGQGDRVLADMASVLRENFG
jgi:hypothetical protein